MTRVRRNRFLRLVSLTAVALTLLVAAGGLSFGRLAAAQESSGSETAVEAGVLEGEPALLDCDGSLTGTAVAPTPATSYAIVSEDSEARYEADEELAGQGAATAVGRTNAFIGSILFDEAGTPLACSRFDVDLRTLVSDESRRDNYLRGNTLETDTYPLATFVLTGVEGLDEPLADGEETTFFLLGDLTLHGVTKAVAWEATATLDDETLEGSATMTFAMPDFNIEEPIVGPVLSVDQAITLAVEISAERAE